MLSVNDDLLLEPEVLPVLGNGGLLPQGHPQGNRACLLHFRRNISTNPNRRGINHRVPSKGDCVPPVAHVVYTLFLYGRKFPHSAVYFVLGQSQLSEGLL